MAAGDIYEELAAHLDKAIAGAPMSPTLIEILKILYPGEEAERGRSGCGGDRTQAYLWDGVLSRFAFHRV